MPWSCTTCKMSDAWRCARQQNLPSIACYCKCHNYIQDDPDAGCPDHGKPIVGDLVRLPKCKIERPVCYDCITWLEQNRRLHPHSNGVIQMRLT